jgi:hypothetical protein
MSALPDEKAVDSFLDRVRRRLILLFALEGAAAGCLVGAVAAIAGSGPLVVTTAVIAGALLRVSSGESWRWGWWRSRATIARLAERRTPLGRNLIVTAAEMTGDVKPYVREVINTRAGNLAAQLDPAVLFPARRTAIALVVAAGTLASSLLRPSPPITTSSRSPAVAGAPVIRSVRVTIVPPAYSSLPIVNASNPASIEALASSRIDLRIDAAASGIRVETLSGVHDVSPGDTGFLASVVAESDGFIAVEPRDAAGATGQRWLIGLSVTPDRAPRVTLSSPGRDLFFSTVPGSIPVVVNANDDLALASLRLRYTAVSGSGERFTFVERDVPIGVNAATPREWTGRGTWRLDELGLAPGDLVVYRAVATDRRPGAPPVESESYVVEVVTPGAIAAEGFAADDQRDRYAVSQQMVILKTERLIASRSRLPADSIAETSRLLAAEQRQVRAEFVFMMGGELEDMAGDAAGTLELNEVAEAEAEGDLLAGRLQNQGRVDMMRAIRAMSRASAALTDTNLDQALRDERAALDNLMRAFARSRFILRALTQRERIDLERRLSGSLTLTAGISGPAVEPMVDARTVALRRLLADIAAMSSGDSADVRDARASQAALALLRADPASDTLRRLAARVQALSRERRSMSAIAVRTRVDSLFRQVALMVARAVPAMPDSRPALDLAVFEGMLRDALERGGRR